MPNKCVYTVSAILTKIRREIVEKMEQLNSTNSGVNEITKKKDKLY